MGRVGRKVLSALLPRLRRELALDFVIVNGENAAGGLGITPQAAQEIFDAGADCITTGNHVWRHKELISYMASEGRILRPANYPPGTVGSGWVTLRSSTHAQTPVGVVCLLGLTFMEPLDCPFRTIDRILHDLRSQATIIIVDFHAEATSEKQAFARYVDGRVTAVVGTHTHVMTADECILPEGTAYITDVGMTGPLNSIIGMKVETVIQRFVTRMPMRFEAAKGEGMLSALLIEADEQTGHAMHVERIVRRDTTMTSENAQCTG